MQLVGRLKNSHIISNRFLRILLPSEFISHFGDSLFNLSVVWSVYSTTKSALMTSLIQVVWQLSDVIASSLAGIIADRWDRKTIMVCTTILSAGTVATFTIIVFYRGIDIYSSLVAILLMNFWTTFFRPARASVLPEVVDKSIYTMVLGWFSTGKMVASLLGSAIGGLIVSGLGIVWALTIDALTFVVLAASISSLNLPKHRVTMEKEQRSMMADLRQGWRVIVAHPIVRPLVMTTMIVNIAAFLGPLYPQLVDERLDGSATAFGLIGAASALASIVAGLSVGLLDTKVGAGRLTAFSWMVAGLCTGIVGVSTSLPLTLLFDGLVGYSVTIGSIASGALSTLLIPSEYRGRAFGIMQSLAVLSIPPSALVGGWASDQFGVTPLFLVGGGIFLFAGLLVLLHPAMRTATVNTPQS